MGFRNDLGIATCDAGFVDLAASEIRAASRVTIEPLAPGIMLIGLQQSYWELAERWRQAPPIFVRHICPAQVTVALPTVIALGHAVAAELLSLIEPSLRFSVQTRIFGEAKFKPFDVNQALAKLIQQETAAPLDVPQPEQILSVVVCANRSSAVAYLGLSPTALNLSDWAGGVRRFKREPYQIGRAEFKLLEAVELFGLELPPNGRALDLGAAPGGWTRVLRQRRQYVTAVDPGELHQSLQQDSAVRHKRMNAEAYLEEGPDQYDLIVNDMRLDARDSSRTMVAYAPYLYRHGNAIMTLKLPEEGREAILDHSFNILKRGYIIAGARQLFHNRSEITVHLRPATAS